LTDFNDLPRDAAGDLILHPIHGWLCGPAMDSVILLALDYTSGPDAPEQVLTFILNPHQALDLAAKLQRHGTRILEQNTPPKSQQS
jgi:hypothetical protein